MIRRRFGFGQVSLAVVGIVAALMLIPGDGGTVEAAKPRALSTSPELTRFLDGAIDTRPAARSSAEVIAEAAAAPEPGQPAKVALPQPPETQVAAVPEPAGPLTSVRSPVNMRSGPSTGHATLMVLHPDERVSVLAQQDGWAQIRKADGTTGWVYGRYLGIGAPEATEPAASEKPIREASAETRTRNDISTNAAVRLRASPSSMSQTIMTVEPGTPMQVAEQRRGWIRVILPDGLSGWIRVRV